ncbi:MAG: flagellar hook-associated protein FlgL [Bacteroidales bacterium]|nr:flagellar hook-associated protein FlgL [Clostridium sp.]MCM1203805.1 flagellar hook-associated protein FlgL [Bacteroidales bacterium]
MRLNHNTMAYTANNNLNTINRNLTKSMQRLSSGYKVNKSSDDAAAKAISQRMNAQIKGLERAINNSNDGISLIQTAEGALDEIHSILARMRELSVQAANVSYAEDDRDSIQNELEQLKEELDRISNSTDFNGRKLLNGELNKKGYTNNDNLSIVEIGGDIEPGEYGLSITSTGTQATTTIGPIADSLVITEAQAGVLAINDFQINIRVGMTGEQINERIRDAASKIGIDYNAATGELKTQQYGSKQHITVDSSYDEIKALLGINGQTEYGTDAVAQFATDTSNARIGFTDTATLETQGNRITVTDKNGFEMVYDASGTVADARITVLSAGPMVIQIGNNEGQTLNVNIGKTTAESLEIDHINVYTHAYASEAIERLDEAVAKISEIRSSLGAYQNRLDHTVSNLETASENLNDAVSRIQDADMAEEITEYTQQNVLSQSALQMLIKSNARPEGLLQLFQR